MSTNKKAPIKEKENIHRLAYNFAGIRRIDTRALARIISWSIGNCERQLMILKCAMNILGDEIQKNREKKNEN